MSRLGGPPAGQLVPARTTLAIPASMIGQVFAVTLDDAAPPNIYAAATSAFGLPIVVPDSDGDGVPDRTRRGAANAGFMPGLFGPPQAGGGPGSIWKIDGLTGSVSLFANVLLDGMPNAGPALGGLAYDPASRQIYVADRGSGMIHSFDLDGVETGRFDHGTQARGAMGLPPVAFDGSRRASIQSPQFDSGNPATWGYAPMTRRVFGLAAYRGRLYYAVAEGLQIWSVALGPGGAFGSDARIELAVPPGAVPNSEVSKILFDDGGDMLLAERGAPTGADDFGALRAHDTGRVLRFRQKPPGAGGTPFHWEQLGDYPVGFPPNFQNGDGGIALGYGYEADGYFNLGACGGTLWSTGSQLRISPNPALAQQLSAGGALPVDGLQGHAASLLRPQNTPPLLSYFIDADDVTQRSGTAGHMGDVATWRACPGLTWLDPMYVETLVVELWCPAGSVRSGGACIPTPCRPGEQFYRGRCVEPRCPPESRTPVRGLCCPAGSTWNAKARKCEPPQACPDGRRTRDGSCCPQPNGNMGSYPPECLPPPPECRPGESRVDCLCRLRGDCPPPPPPQSGDDRPPQGQCRPGETRAQCLCRLRGNCPPPPPGDDKPPPGDSTQPCPPGQIAFGNLCVTVPPPPPPGDRAPGDSLRPPPDFGRIPPPRDGAFQPPAFCQGGPFRLVGGTCCAGNNYTCTRKPMVGNCAGTETEVGPPFSAVPACCRPDTGSVCAPPQSNAPSCEPIDHESRLDRCERWYADNNDSLRLSCITGLGFTTDLCFSDLDCGPGNFICRRDGKCVYGQRCPSGQSAPASTAACQPPLIRVGETCCSPETVAAGLCRSPPPSQPRCTGGKVLSDNACRCPEGTSENARGRCVTPPPPPTANSKKKRDPVCKKGSHREGGRCVPNVRRPPVRESEPQAVPNIGIGIGIGVGGGGRGINRPGRPGGGRLPPGRGPGGGGMPN